MKCLKVHTHTYMYYVRARPARNPGQAFGSCKLIADANSRDENMSDIFLSCQHSVASEVMSESASLIRQASLETLSRNCKQ